MKPYTAIRRMRKLTKSSIPFSITFLSCNLSSSKSKGLITVDKCILRTGYSQEHSTKHNSLMGYTNLDTMEHRSFYIPLLLKFNNIDIQ